MSAQKRVKFPKAPKALKAKLLSIKGEMAHPNHIAREANSRYVNQVSTWIKEEILSKQYPYFIAEVNQTVVWSAHQTSDELYRNAVHAFGNQPHPLEFGSFLDDCIIWFDWGCHFFVFPSKYVAKKVFQHCGGKLNKKQFE